MSQQLVDKLQPPTEEEEERDKYKVKQKFNGDLLRQSVMDQNFLSYQIQFDQAGEF